MPRPSNAQVRKAKVSKPSRKCMACHGRGQVRKYILPNVTDLVKCPYCKGTGRIIVDVSG